LLRYLKEELLCIKKQGMQNEQRNQRAC